MEGRGAERMKVEGWGDVKELGTKPITLYVLIAPIHLNVDQLNLDLKIQDVGTV